MAEVSILPASRAANVLCMRGFPYSSRLSNYPQDYFDYTELCDSVSLFVTKVKPGLGGDMRVEIQAFDFTLTSKVRDHIERRIGVALSSRFRNFRKIVVRVSNAGRTAGTSRKRCQIHIKLPRLKDILVQDTHSDLFSAIDRAVDRAGRAVYHRLERDYYTSRTLYVARNSAPIEST